MLNGPIAEQNLKSALYQNNNMLIF